uniref:Protein shisa-5 n=1 Tax=Clastoptera arizonana TaxID=38151 RepID=A0A1B6DYY4_9HEMI
MTGNFQSLFIVLSILDSSFAEFCDNGQCIDEGYILGKIVSFAIFVTLGTLIICCPCIVYKHCCVSRNPGIVFTPSTGVAVNVNTTYPPNQPVNPAYPAQGFQQPGVYPIYGIPPPEYTATAPPLQLPLSHLVVSTHAR